MTKKPSKKTRKTLTKLKKELGEIIHKERADRKKLEKQNKELLKKTEELTKLHAQMKQKTSELEAAYQEIAELLKIKTDFMNRAAHDLRTPLTPIVTLLPIIKDQIKDKTILKDLTIVEKNTKYLRELVDELLEFIKTGQHEFESKYEKIKVCNLIKEVLSHEGHIFKVKKIKVIKNFRPVPKVHANKLRLTEVIRNIIANALKFMPKGGKLTINVFKRDNFIYIRIKDTGIGLTKKNLSLIFDPFFKADSSMHTEGTGLGLTICKKIIEGYHGKMWAESKGLGKGSAFVITLPLLRG